MNKEQLRKELEDATEWGFNHNWINFKTWASDRDTYITTRLAALDDGDWKENFKEWYYATEEERSDMVSAEQCVEWIEKNIIGNGEDWKEDGVVLIAAERERQKKVEGWTADHDKQHFYGELAKAAACYAVEHTDSEVVEHGENAWPWDDKWWKPSLDPIKNLVKAGALIAAEIDRIKPRTP